MTKWDWIITAICFAAGYFSYDLTKFIVRKWRGH